MTNTTTIKPGDVVTITNGTRRYDVLRVAEDMARIAPQDPADPRDPAWVSMATLRHPEPADSRNGRPSWAVMGPHANTTDSELEAYDRESARRKAAAGGTTYGT